MKYDVLIRTRSKKNNHSLDRTLKAWSELKDAKLFKLIVLEGLEKKNNKVEIESLGSLTNRLIAKSKSDVVFICDDDVTPSNNVIELTYAIKDNVAKANAQIAISDSKMRRMHDAITPPCKGFSLCAIKGDVLRDFKLNKDVHCHEPGLFADYLLARGKLNVVVKGVVGVHHSNNWRKKLLNQVKWFTANKRYQSDKGLQPHEPVYTKARMRKEMKDASVNLQLFNRLFAKEYQLAIKDGFNEYKRFLRGV